ncbi:MAG: sugar nucleotide-binding protein [Bdellovibrionota bacterium]
MKTILVIGASGFIGSNVVNYLRKRHKVVAAFSRNILRFPGVSHFLYTLNDRDYMKRMIMLVKPDVIIYCAGVTDFVECAKKPRVAEAVNSFGPVVVAGASDTISHRFIFLSSAYVYDGRKGNFSEGDVVLPQTNFGKGKLAGENYVRSKFLTSTILRLSPVFGLGSLYHPSPFDRIRIKLERGQQVELPQNEIHSFLSINVALQAIEWAATSETQNRTYNLGGLTKLSWYEFGLLIAESFGFDPNLIVARPGQFDTEVDFSLNGSDLVRQLQIDPLILEQGLDLLKQELVCRALPGHS